MPLTLRRTKNSSRTTALAGLEFGFIAQPPAPARTDGWVSCRHFDSRVKHVRPLQKKPFPGFTPGKGLGDRAKIFEDQLAASLWPQRFNRAVSGPNPPDHSLVNSQ
jgi:hypothetical protein